MAGESFKFMFGENAAPVLRFSLPEISLKAQGLAGKLSISGVQPKLSVKFDKKLGELVPAPEAGEYILKPSPSEFPRLAENEQCCMDIAQAMGIDVPSHCLLPLLDGNCVYVVKRFDRQGAGKIHQEDFSQLLDRDKYAGSVEQVGRKLKDISAVPGLDVQLLFERVVFNFLIGNGDAHLKNYSINYDHAQQIRLSPAYDLVSSKLAIPQEEDESALAINGKKNKLTRNDFDAAADYLKIPAGVRYEKFAKKSDVMKTVVRSSNLNQEEQSRFIAIIEARYARI